MTREPTDKAGWEVEGFVTRLTKRDDANSERLVLEAISHLRGFSRDCDTLRDNSQEQRAEIERLRAALESLTKDPPATLDEPDADAEVIIKMRAIARAALLPQP